MTTATQALRFPENLPVVHLRQPAKRRISWATFEKEYLLREDGYRYEWLDGEVLKTKTGMNTTQLFIQMNLEEIVARLRQAQKIDGHLLAEPDLFFNTKHRRPDFAWLSKKQILNMALPNSKEVPVFVIEVVSGGDQTGYYEDKFDNYRDAGVQVVWQILPKKKRVNVFSGKNLDEMKVYFSGQICSAEPAVPGFKIPVDEIFYHPNLP